MKKRMINLFFCFALLFILTPDIWAGEADMPLGGVCGEGVVWTIEGTVLRISGAGAIPDFENGWAPWFAAREAITSVEIGPEIRAIGTYAFSGLREVTEVTFTGDAPVLGEGAFQNVLAWVYYPSRGSGWTEATGDNRGGILRWESYCIHEYSDYVISPTCSRQGYSDHVCRFCGERYTDCYTEMTRHEMMDWVAEDGYDQTVRTVSHRGSALAPENTLDAFALSGKQGYHYVETDVRFTKDGVPVLLHDKTIDRTSDGSGKVADYTYEELMDFDFGSWKSAEYTGTKIPSFAEFLQLCGEMELEAYVELKSIENSEQLETLVKLAEAYDMGEHITWIAFDAARLQAIAEMIPGARLGYLVSNVDETATEQVRQLEEHAGEVFLGCYYGTVSEETVALAKNSGIPLEVWTVNDEAWIASMDPYISGITSDTCIAGKVLGQAEPAGNWRRSCRNCDYYERGTDGVL